MVIFGYCKYLKEHINFPDSIGFVVSVSADSSEAARGGGVIKKPKPDSVPRIMIFTRFKALTAENEFTLVFSEGKKSRRGR